MSRQGACGGRGRDRRLPTAGSVLIPEIDAKAHVEREQELERRVAELEAEREDILLVLLVEERLACRGPGRGKPIEEVARRLGFGELVDGS